MMFRKIFFFSQFTATPPSPTSLRCRRPSKLSTPCIFQRKSLVTWREMVEEAGDGHDIYSSYKSIHNASFSQYNNIIIINLYICKLPVGRLSLRSLRATVVATETLFTMLTKMYNFIILLNDEPPLPFCLILPPPRPNRQQEVKLWRSFSKCPVP